MIRPPHHGSKLAPQAALVATMLALIGGSLLASGPADADHHAGKDPKSRSSMLTPPEVLTARLDSLGHYFLNQNAVAGLAIAVAYRGEVVYEKAFGHLDADHSKPADTESVFLLASVSKLIGATIAMKLVEEDRLGLDDPLAKLLPEFPRNEQAERITLRHLLAHTSGLEDYASVIDSVYEETNIDPTHDDLLEFFANHDLDFVPGTDFNYSNSGYVLLPAIIEHATGSTFEEEINRVINEPAGINLTMLRDNLDNPHLTEVFDFADTTLVPLPHWPWIRGDGGLTATAGDLVKFPFAWATTILSKESFTTMCTPIELPDGISTGYGLGVRTGIFEGEPAVGHTGGNKTAAAVMKYYPELEAATVVFVNADGTPTGALHIDGHVSLQVLGKEEPDLERLEITAESLDRFVGEYRAVDNYYSSGRSLTLAIDASDGHLYRKYTDSDSKGQKLYYLGNNTFGYEPYTMDRVVFTVDDQGRAVAFNNFLNGLKKSGLFRKVR